jgi:hypothetical protein
MGTLFLLAQHVCRARRQDKRDLAPKGKRAQGKGLARCKAWQRITAKAMDAWEEP